MAPNRIEVLVERVQRYSLFLNEQLVDPTKPLVVLTNGQVSFEGSVTPSLETLLRQARLRQDSGQLFPDPSRHPGSKAAVMIPEWLCSRRAGSLALLVVIGLSTTIYSGLANSETCSLPSQHAGVTFPIEQVDPDWACRL